MGRKKIEIQPITHERNRSVTFLKRKNGLFKKAYELGVLCSVDVAVIIFEERPGHHVKLYQYSSGDIHDIVQRHLRHDGEKDHKGPADFSGNTSTKTDDIGDDNDEDVDDDEDLPSRGKRGRDGKLKPPPDMRVAGMDYSHRSLSIPQAPPLSMHNPGHQGGPGLPISSDRFSNIRGTGKRSSSTAPFPGARQSGSGYHHATQQHHQTPQYPPFFPPQTSPSFMQTTGPGISSRSGQGYNISHHAGPSSPGNYDSAPIYPNIMGRPGSTPMQGSGPGGGGSLFSTFLEADEQSRHHQSHQQGQPQTGGFGLEWPVHGPGNANATSGHPSLPGPVTNPPPASSTDNSGQGSNNTWLDFLSSNNPPAGSTAREVMSWERGGGPPSSNSELYVDRGRHGGAGSPMVANIVSAGKRSPGSGLLSSPLTTVNGGDDGNKDIPG